MAKNRGGATVAHDPLAAIRQALRELGDAVSKGRRNAAKSALASLSRALHADARAAALLSERARLVKDQTGPGTDYARQRDIVVAAIKRMIQENPGLWPPMRKARRPPGVILRSPCTAILSTELPPLSVALQTVLDESDEHKTERGDSLLRQDECEAINVWMTTIGRIVATATRLGADGCRMLMGDALPVARSAQGFAVRGEAILDAAGKLVAELDAAEARSEAAAPFASPKEAPTSSNVTSLDDLEPAIRKAWLSYQWAESKAGRRLEDREAFDLIHEEGIPVDAGESGALTDYQLPSFDSWSKYLRVARKALGESKYQPRAGRAHGKSVIRSRDLDSKSVD